MWLTIGAAALGVVSSLLGSDAEKKALRRQQEARIAAFKSQEEMTKFAVQNNSQRANEIAAQQAGEIAVAGRELVKQERQAIGEEVIRRGEGITAGRSVERSVDDVIATGNKAKGELRAKQTSAFQQVQGQARDANSRETAQLNEAHEQMKAGIAADQAAMPSGIDMALGALSAGMSGAQSGANLTSSLKGTDLGKMLKIK